MDFSLNVDPSLQSAPTSVFSPSSSSNSAMLEYMASYDFDLYSEGLDLYPSMVYQTIEPSQLTDSSDSPASPYSPSLSSAFTSPSPPPRSPSYTSDTSSSESATRSRRRMNKRTKADEQNLATDYTSVSVDHRHSPYDKDHNHHVKRHQTKLACTWCRKLSKKCDTQRPCGRCVQFNRCSECVDAPPRKPRAKGVDRGTYKKTRDLAAVDYDQAVSKREAYVAKQERLGRSVQVGLSPDEILEKTRKDDVRIGKELQREVGKMVLPPNMDLGESLPFTGPLEDLFTCSASPEIEEPTFSSPPSSSEDSFDVSSPTDSNSILELEESDLESFIQWKRLWDLYPEPADVGFMAQEPDEHAMTTNN